MNERRKKCVTPQHPGGVSLALLRAASWGADCGWVSLTKLLKHIFSDTVHFALSVPYRSKETRRDPFKKEHFPHWASWDILITWKPSHPYNFIFFSNDGKNQPTNKKHYPLLKRVSSLLTQPVWTPLCSPLPNPAFLFKSPNFNSETNHISYKCVNSNMLLVFWPQGKWCRFKLTAHLLITCASSRLARRVWEFSESEASP